MIQKTTTVVLNGSSKAEYEAILVALAKENAEASGWMLIKEPVRNCVTATKTEEVNSL